MRTPRIDHESQSQRLAIVVIDIEDSTGWVIRLGDPSWLTALLEHRRLVRRRVAQFGGRELATTGDGFILAFPEVDLAARCMAAIRDDHHRCADSSIRDLRVRVGLHAGRIERASDGTWVGRDLHLASRVASVADGDEMVASPEAFADEPGLEERVLGARCTQLRGFPGRRSLFVLSWK
jgi:class 3 adenylate cyclase